MKEKESYLLSGAGGRSSPFGEGDPGLRRRRAAFPGEDARCLLPGGRAEAPAPRPPAPRTYLQAPARRCAGSDLLGPRLEGSAPCALVAPGVCPASPSDSRGAQAPPSRAGQSALPAAALAHAAANKRARHGPPPPAGGGRRGGGRVRPPPAQQSGSWRRKREGRERGLRQWKRRPRTSINQGRGESM